ncbi:hypothetical protein [Pseudarthrobacter sp. H2]
MALVNARDARSFSARKTDVSQPRSKEGAVHRLEFLRYQVILEPLLPTG